MDAGLAVGCAAQEGPGASAAVDGLPGPPQIIAADVSGRMASLDHSLLAIGPATSAQRGSGKVSASPPLAGVGRVVYVRDARREHAHPLARSDVVHRTTLHH